MTIGEQMKNIFLKRRSLFWDSDLGIPGVFVADDSKRPQVTSSGVKSIEKFRPKNRSFRSKEELPSIRKSKATLKSLTTLNFLLGLSQGLQSAMNSRFLCFWPKAKTKREWMWNTCSVDNNSETERWRMEWKLLKLKRITRWGSFVGDKKL